MDDVFSELTETSTTSPKLFVDCSTVNPGTSRKWQRLWAERGSAMLDAPVSGGVTGATDASLTFMVGCDNEQDLHTARPYLDRMGKRVFLCGGPGNGSTTKLCT